MKKYKSLFFDLDGTLWDITANTRAAFEILFERHKKNGMADVDFEKFLATYLVHNERVWTLYRMGKIEKGDLRIVRFQKTFSDLQPGTDKKFIEQFSEEFIESCPRQPHLIEGAREVLEACNGNYQMHIITNGFIEIQGLKMRAGDIAHLFGHVINSEECKARKPQREIFDYAIRKSGALKNESLMIGDDWEADILGARDFGMDQAWLKNGSSAHNYSPTYTLNKMSDLLSIL